jgi:hypothetical protein
MKQQNKPKALHGLDGYGSATDGVGSLLHELGGESTKSGMWSWHCGFRSLLGFLGVHLFLQKSAETTTLFVKRTTKGANSVGAVSEPRPTLFIPVTLSAHSA